MKNLPLKKTYEWETTGARGLKLIYKNCGNCTEIVEEINFPNENKKILIGCNKPLCQEAVENNLMGSAVSCEYHLREYFSQWGSTLEEEIEKKKKRPGMIGQLWEPCHCGVWPVCASCLNCENHCTCGKPIEPKISIECEEPYRIGIGQGFGSTEDA